MTRASRLLRLWVLVSAASSAATLAGRIVEDHSGDPVASAEVRVYLTGASGLAAELESDGSGRFEAKGLLNGAYRLEFAKRNYLPTSLRVELADEPAPSLAVRLIRCGVIGGQVRDPRGQPFRGGHVYALRREAGGWLRRPDFSPGRYAALDAAGRYRLYNLAPGAYGVALSYGASAFLLGSTGMAPAEDMGSGVLLYPSSARPEVFRIQGGEEHRNIDFTLLSTQRYSVSGKVELPPAPPDGEFWLALAAVDQPGLATAVTRTKPDGVFRFDGVAPGSYHLLASGPSLARGGRGAVLPPGARFARTRVEVAAQPVEGIVLSPRQARNATLSLDAGEASCRPSAEIVLRSEEDWAADLERRSPISFRAPVTLSGLAPARYRVSVLGLGETCDAPDSLLLDLSGEDSHASLAIPVRAAGSIRGRVRAVSLPASDLVVVLMADGEGVNDPVRVAVPNAQGRFAFPALRPMRYRMAVVRGSRQRWRAAAEEETGIEVPPGREVEAILAPPPPEPAQP